MDSPEKYKNKIFADPSLIKQVDNCIFNDGPHDDMANIIHFIYKNEYINVDLKDAIRLCGNFLKKPTVSLIKT